MLLDAVGKEPAVSDTMWLPNAVQAGHPVEQPSSAGSPSKIHVRILRQEHVGDARPLSDNVLHFVTAPFAPQGSASITQKCLQCNPELY